MSHQEDLKRLEDKRKRKIKTLLLGILLSSGSESELIPKIKKSASEILEEIKDVRKAAFAIADRYSPTVHRASDKDRQLMLVAATLYISSVLARRVSISEKPSYISKSIQAIEDTTPAIERLVNTEIYEANLRKTIANCKNEDVKMMWNAINDKRSCDVCSALDGNIYKAEEVPDYPHPNCRCFCEIVSNQ